MRLVAEGTPVTTQRTSFTLIHDGVLYSIQADVACRWTKYQRQTHMSPEEPVTLEECELDTLIEVLIDATGEEPVRTVGLMTAISAACADRDTAEPGLVPLEEDERTGHDD